jgi:hypothetical protein
MTNALIASSAVPFEYANSVVTSSARPFVAPGKPLADH